MKNCWTQKVHLAVAFSKGRLDVHLYIKKENRPYSAEDNIRCTLNNYHYTCSFYFSWLSSVLGFSNGLRKGFEKYPYLSITEVSQGYRNILFFIQQKPAGCTLLVLKTMYNCTWYLCTPLVFHLTQSWGQFNKTFTLVI